MIDLRPDGPTAVGSVDVDVDGILSKATAENFPVAMRVLPRRYREQLLAIYGYARLVDDIGDRSSGDRLAELDWAEAEVDRALAGTATHPIFVRIGSTARAIGAGRDRLVDLIEANRRDQIVHRYETFAELEGYCALSANPVGRLVLAVFGRGADEEAARLSDDVCTGLQLVEHCQDIGEDYAAGRVYLPKTDLETFAVDEGAIATGAATAAMRRLLAFECARARGLLGSGVALVASLSSYGRLAVAGFVGGGLAQLDAIEQRRFDVLSSAVKASKPAVLGRTLGVLRSARRWR